VVEQLRVIEGRTREETELLSTAYLTTPTLVGREPLLARVRRRLKRARAGRGSALLIHGASGVGRSRLLAACLLEAKLQGVLALRADASDSRDYDALRRLCEQLLRMAPQPTLRAAAQEPELARVLPELWEQNPSAAPVLPELPPAEQRARVFEALRRWLFEIAREQPLLIAMDDLHRLDEPSLAALALLLRDIGTQPVLFVGSVPSSALVEPPAALRVFAQSATEQALTPLDGPQTQELLRSVFGAVPHLAAVSQELFAISCGNPRDLMDLAQSLVASGLAQHHAGIWTLPASMSEGVLPGSMLQELRARITRLSPLAHEILGYVALAADRALSFEEHAWLCAPRSPAEVSEALSELMRAQLLAASGASYALHRRSATSLLGEQLTPERERAMHQRLAHVFGRGGDEEVRRAAHLIEAGDGPAGLEVLLAATERSQALTDADPQAFFALTASLPAKWFECYLSGLELCASHPRPKRSRYTLAYRMAGLFDVMNVPGELGIKPLCTLLDQLSEDSGLADWARLDPALEPIERLKQAIGAAQARYDACPEAERGYDPLTAIRVLVRGTIGILAYAAKNLDWRLLETLPSLEPLVVLSPAVAIVHKVGQGITARTTGRFERAREHYAEVIRLTAQPGTTGLDETHQRYLRLGVMFGLGWIEANLGLATATDWANELEHEPMHRINAQQLRLLHALWQGQMAEAERLQGEIEAMRLKDGVRQWMDGASLVSEAVVNALSDDLTRVQRTCESIEPLARRHRPWAAVLAYAEAEHQRICGDLRGARQKLETLLASIEAGQHQIWPNASGTHVRVLHELGELERACEVGESYLQRAEHAGLGAMVSYVKLPLALALAERGQLQRAQQLTTEVLAVLSTLGASGLNVVLAHETAARIALLAQDFTRFEQHCRTCESLAAGQNARALVARCEKLKRHGRARRARLEATGHGQHASQGPLDEILRADVPPRERAVRILEWLVASSHARGGILFVQQMRRLTQCAQTPDAQPGAALQAELERFMFAQTSADQHTQSLTGDDAREPGRDLLQVDEHGDRYRAVLLGHQSSLGFVASGVAVLIESESGKLSLRANVIARASEELARCEDVELTCVS
jgi:hypothetical protein